MKRLTLFVLLSYVAVSASLGEPASADTQLSGYSASADAAVVRVEVFDPSIPIPAEPEGDVSLVYARSTASTGPSTRALATYLWPGDALGDGLGTLAGNPALDYPVKVNSRYPATTSSPATNKAQLNDASGMVTSTDGYTTLAATTGVGVGANALTGIGSGLCGILPAGTCPNGLNTSSIPTLPLPTALTGLLSVAGGKAQGGVTINANSITAASSATASNISILGGVVNIDGFKIATQASSDGTTATTQKTLNIAGLSVAGTAENVTDQTNSSGGSVPGVPNKSIDVPQLGISVKYLQSQKSISGAGGSMNAQGLQVTIDLSVLSKQLQLGTLAAPLGQALSQIPTLGPLLQGLLKFGTKLVIVVGSTNTSASAAPPYNGNGITSPGGSSGSGGSGGTGSSGVGSGVGGTGSLGSGAGVPSTGSVGSTSGPTTSGGTTSGPSQPAAFTLPGLGQTPSILILVLLGLAGLFGWLFRLFGTYMLGGADCAQGLRVAVPNLRKV